MRKLLFILLLLASCSSLKQDQKNLIKIQIRHPELMAPACATMFPVKDSVGESTVIYIPADNKNYQPTIDSLSNALISFQKRYNDAVADHEGDTSCQATIRQLKRGYDSLFSAFMDFKAKYIPCKPDSVKIEVPVFRENTAKLADLNNQVSALKEDNTVLKKANKSWRNTALILGGCLGLGIFLKLKNWI